MNVYWLTVGVLGVWRLAHLLNAEDGPWDALARLRRGVGNGFWGTLLDCFCCLTVWVAAPFAYWLGEGWKEQLFLWPALSGGAIVLERFVSGGQESNPPRAQYFEQPEDP